MLCPFCGHPATGHGVVEIPWLGLHYPSYGTCCADCEACQNEALMRSVAGDEPPPEVVQAAKDLGVLLPFRS